MKLESVPIPHYCWTEPDNDMGFTAIATVALTEEEKEVLRHYRLWKHVGGAGQPACGLIADAHANSPLAQAESVSL